MSESNLTIVYYTSNKIPDKFAENTRNQLTHAVGNLPLITVSQKPMNFGRNICVGDIGTTHLNIYRQALIGAKKANTKYIAMAEDDVLYSPEHFLYIPRPNHFAYDKHIWAIYTWSKPPVFSWKDRINLYAMICERDLFIEAMEERFAKWPDDSKISLGHWAEPGKYESRNHLGVTERNIEIYFAKVPSIAFSHQTALSFSNLGTRKKLGVLQAFEIPVWGKAEDIVRLYE